MPIYKVINYKYLLISCLAFNTTQNISISESKLRVITISVILLINIFHYVSHYLYKTSPPPGEASQAAWEKVAQVQDSLQSADDRIHTDPEGSCLATVLSFSLVTVIS